MKLNYKRCGDYLIPDIAIHHTPRPLGYYGQLRKSYLKQYNPIYYNELVLTEKLFDHCLEIENAAQLRMEQLMPALAKDAGATDELKATDQLKWVGLMNACRNQAEEIINAEIIYNYLA